MSESEVTPVSEGLPTNSLLQLIESRHCCRAFDPEKPVPKDIITSVLKAARNAPSSKNSQAWSVLVVRGKAVETLKTSMVEVFNRNNDKVDKKGDYQNRQKPLPERLDREINKYGEALYTGIMGFDRSDKKSRRASYGDNYNLWGAGTLLLLTIPKGAVAGTFVDAGLFLQNILLGFHSFGLGAIPQYSVAAYGTIIRKQIDGLDEQVIVCGISVGYPIDGPLTGWFPPRMEVDEFVQWVE